MKFAPFIAVAALSPVISVSAQTPSSTPAQTRPRIIVVGQPTPTPRSTIIVTDRVPAPTPTPIIVGRTPSVPTPPVSGNGETLGLREIRQRLAEAKREMAGRPLTIASVDNVLPGKQPEMVRIAFYDFQAKRLDYVTLTKQTFHTKNSEFILTTQNQRTVRFRSIRPNGVNTPVTLIDMSGRQHLPLMVQYPVIRGGIYYETAYYMSTHPGLVTPEVVNAGKAYVRNTIDIARESLRLKGFSISSKAADIAERLAIVEHVDHLRFRTEPHPFIFNDVFTLYALNEGQTYRYSVSSAGAGGMIQMIPSTYRLIRSRFPGAGLMPDFVAGMQNHANAAQAMLLYIQLTYDDLVKSPTIVEALQTGIATDFELLSAGYNSNPARLPGYIKRGGAGWRSLIPRETQIYLQINASLDRHVPFVRRTR